MNKFIEEQLQKVNIADLSNFDKSINTYYIPQVKDISIKVDSCYVIKLDETLLNPYTNDILVCNWNHNTYPQQEYLKVDVLKVMNKMIYINGIGFDYVNKVDTNYIWSGWLPINQIKIIEEL